MRKSFIAAVLVGGLVMSVIGGLPTSGRASDTNGAFVMFGHGGITCGSFLSDYRSGDTRLYLSWLGGYLTATNRLTDDTYNIGAGRDLSVLFQWIATYCHRNPLDNMEVAAQRLILTLYPERHRQEPAVSVPPPPVRHSVPVRR